MVKADAVVLGATKGISTEEADKAEIQAAELVRQIEEAGGSHELDLLDGITSVGVQAQRDAAGQLELLKTRIGTLLNEGGAGADMAKGLRDLRETLRQIDPHEVGNAGIGWRVLGVLPILNGPESMVVRNLNKIAIRYEPVSRQITQIETKLREGQAMLVRDNVELRRLYEDVERQQPSIRQSAYLGELLIERLTDLMERTDDPAKCNRVQEALHGVAMRVQGLRAMEQVHIQYFLGIEMTWQNNKRLSQSVEQTLTLATNVVTVGLAIQAALIRQKDVKEATERTREFLGDLITANAASIRQHTDQIGDLQNSPVIALEKIAQAHDDLVEALDTASRLRQEGITIARDNIATLTRMSTGLAQRVGGLAEKNTPAEVAEG
jgi:uncharacterized protein YaaN involved in tellurite resistance